MQQQYISKEGYEKLKKKLKHLIDVEKPAIIKQIAIAREHGDLSENAEYHAAREKKRLMEMEIAELEKKITSLNIIDSESVNKNEIRFGAKIKLYNLQKKIISFYKIVGEDETRGKGKIRKISCNAPLARALLGKKEGEIVKFKAPVGILKYKIKKIEYEDK